jgi:hypothetical protein
MHHTIGRGGHGHGAECSGAVYGRERVRQLARAVEHQWNEDPGNDPFAIK